MTTGLGLQPSDAFVDLSAYLPDEEDGAVVPQYFDDWPALVNRAVGGAERLAELRAALSNVTAPGDMLMEQIELHNNAIGPIRTRDMAAVDTLLTHVLRFNRANGPGRGWVGIDFEGNGAGAGKTELIVGLGALRTAQVWGRFGRTEHLDAGTERARIPFAYVHVNSQLGARGLMRATMRFFNQPYKDSATGDVLLGQLHGVLRRHGTTVIVYDDAHQLHPQPGEKDHAGMSDFLKSMVDGLSATLVFVGNGLDASVLLSASTPAEAKAVEQLRIRMRRHTFAPCTVRSHADLAELRKIMRVLEKNLIIPGRELTGALTDDETLKQLIVMSEGRIGRAITLVRWAAAFALRTEEPFNSSFIQRANPDPATLLLAKTAPNEPRQKITPKRGPRR